MARLGFSNEDFINLMLIYSECDKVFTRTCTAFIERYPEAPRPTPDTIRRMLSNCRTHGSFKPNNLRRIRPVVDNQINEVNVLAYFNAYPEASLRNAERDLDITYVSICRILKKHKFHPFAFQLVQHLRPGDYERRVHFCEWLLTRFQEDNNFLNNIIWSDEAKFSKDGMFNKHNSHFWSIENPHVIRNRQYQERWSFNVYCAIQNNSVVYLHFYDENLNGERYLTILENFIETYADNLPLNQRAPLWYQHDGAGAHGNRFINDCLEANFGDQWIANNGPYLWPARSPDLTPLDFFVWGYIKDKVYDRPLTTKENCEWRVRDAFGSLEAENIISATGNGVYRRALKCLEVNGGHFEHLLK